MKTCNRCGETKPLDDFPPRSRKQSRDGRGSYCRPCNRELTRERMRRWRARNPERARQRAREDSRKLRERNPDYHRGWYRENAESERERSREVMRELRKTRPELERETRRRYRERHRERIRARERAHTHQRRAVKAATANSMLGGYTSAYMVDYIAQLLQQPCFYCGDVATTLDHVVPLSRGGLHIPANLAPACTRCNCSKSDRLLSEWCGVLS